MIKVIDNFLSPNQFEEVCHTAHNQEYGTYHFAGDDYYGINADHHDHPIIHEVAKVLAEELGAFGLKSSFSIFRAGHQPTRWIHADNACGGYAAVLYLTEHEELTGTAIWTHKDITVHPQLGITQEECDRINNGDCEIEQMWNMKQFIWAKKNRLAIYSANEFHSVYPQKGPADRRVLVTFINQNDE